MTINDALLLGQRLHHAGDFASAARVYEQIIRAAPDQADAWAFLASANQSLGKLGEAEACYREAARLRPGHAETYNGLGIVLAQLGRPAEAVEHFRHVLTIKPDHALAHSNLGNILREMGRLTEAEASCREALRLKPDYPEAYNNLGNALLAQGRTDEAIASLRAALRLRPNYPRAYNNLGAALAAQRKFAEAVECYREALRLQPDFFQVHNNLGVAYYEQRQFDNAAACYREAIRHRPDFADAYTNLGITLQEVWKLDEALPYHQRAIELRPDFADAHNQIAMIHMAQGRVEEAAASYRRSLEFKDEPRVHSNLLLCLNYLPDLSPDALYAEHLRWDERHGPGSQLGPLPGHDCDPKRRLRIGYVSPDLRKHAVAYFFEPILANHDPEQVETFCYAHVPNPDGVTARLQKLAHGWRAITHLSDADAVEQIRADRIDILVDLAGHAGNKRLRLFAHKPAPLQITYLGYPNTTGMRAVDYRLTDAVADPPGEPVRHSEELVRLPGCFCCYRPPDEAPEVRPLPALRRGHFTFGSVHGLAKLNGRVYDLWAAILRAAPDARLCVVRDVLKGRTTDEFLQALRRHAVPVERVDIRADATDHTSYLRLYEDIDLCLDAFPFSGHTTACESLWMGVPVVTLYGDRFGGRMTASVLTCLGLNEFVARTPEEYVEVAANWTANPGRLAEVRARLREQMRQSPLCDGRAFTSQLEQVYRSLWRRWTTDGMGPTLTAG